MGRAIFQHEIFCREGPGDIVREEIDEADETDLWGTLVG
jgi:hypothetical protein